MAPTKRPPYRRPSIELIPLHAEEVLLAACKMNMGNSMAGKNGTGTCTMPMACFNGGS
jgi:hypothetical protein